MKLSLFDKFCFILFDRPTLISDEDYIRLLHKDKQNEHEQKAFFYYTYFNNIDTYTKVEEIKNRVKNEQGVNNG